jgi:hypothetical protein
VSHDETAHWDQLDLDGLYDLTVTLVEIDEDGDRTYLVRHEIEAVPGREFRTLIYRVLEQGGISMRTGRLLRFVPAGRIYSITAMPRHPEEARP